MLGECCVPVPLLQALLGECCVPIVLLQALLAECREPVVAVVVDEVGVIEVMSRCDVVCVSWVKEEALGGILDNECSVLGVIFCFAW